MKKIILITAICAICTQAHSQWSITGNAGTNSSTNFIGTTDNKTFKIRTNNVVRMTISSAGKAGIGTASPVFKLDVKGGSINTDSVYRIGGNTVLSVQGTGNTFTGIGSGFSNTSGIYNTANGVNALYSNTTGHSNTASGINALVYNTTGHSNTAYGRDALFYNTTGVNNTAIGRDALFFNTAGITNTAIGLQSLYFNTTGSGNTANGYGALRSNTEGHSNTAIGISALYSNTTGTQNTAIGYQSLFYNTTGYYNTAIGYLAGVDNGFNPSNFTAIGYSAGQVNNNYNSVEIGNTNVLWIGGQVGWSMYSDKRIKDNIQSNVPGLSFITKLNPVTYNLNIHRQNEMCGINDSNEWEGKYDLEKITQTGFLAQEVEQAAREVNYDFNGVRAPYGNAKLYSVQYASFVVPLVKAVQELNEELKSDVASLKSENEILKSEVRSQKLENEKLKIEIAEIKIALRLQPKSSDIRPLISVFLEQNSPNPFNSSTEIKFQLPSTFSSAQLIITDANGKQVRNDILKSSSSVIVKAAELSAGTYNYSLVIDGVNVDSKQMILTK